MPDAIETPTTLITGTRKGIGRFLAEHYVRLGHRVFGVSRTAPDWALDGYSHFEADVADEGAVTRVLREVRRRGSRLHHLVNNAGIASMNHVLATPTSTVRGIFDTNVMGTFLFAREAAKLMAQARFGRIVNFTTVA